MAVEARRELVRVGHADREDCPRADDPVVVGPCCALEPFRCLRRVRVVGRIEQIEATYLNATTYEISAETE